MEKDNKFKFKFPSFFTSTCKTQNLSEVIAHSKDPIFTRQSSSFLQPPLIEQLHDDEEHDPLRTLLVKPKQTSSSSSSASSSYNAPSSMMCKPRRPESFDNMVKGTCIVARNSFPRRKPAVKYSMLPHSGEFSGRRCPPASPETPMFQQPGKKNKKKKKKVQEKRRLIRSNHNNNVMEKKNTGFNPNPFSFSSSNETDNGDLFSSDDEREEDEKENMFSLNSVSFSSKCISLSSDSDTSYPVQTRARARARARPMEGKVKVKDTFAVVKSSTDPYNDFRTSMAEMIIEKQIFGAKELEQLLKCFLSLNYPHHHRVIVEVFTEIFDALFSHCL